MRPSLGLNAENTRPVTEVEPLPGNSTHVQRRVVGRPKGPEVETQSPRCGGRALGTAEKAQNARGP